MPFRDLITLDKLTPSFVERFLKAHANNQDAIPVEINALQSLARYPTRQDRAFQLHLLLEARVDSEIKKLRKQLGLPALGESRNLMDPVRLLAEEFSQNSTSLEMWSAVYHRFFTPYPQSITDLCAAANVNKRRFYRRRDDGLAALTQMLVMAEVEARQEIQGLQLYERLPQRTYAVLEERDALIRELRVMIDDPHGPRLFSLEALAGSGKTVVARQLVEDLTLFGLLRGVAWVEFRANGSAQPLVPSVNTISNASDVVESIVQQFDFGDVLGGMPPTEQVSRLRDALSEELYVVVLDGVEILDDPGALLEMLYPLTLRVVIVMTSRRSLGHIPGVLVRTLPGLSIGGMRKIIKEACERNQVVCQIDDTQAFALHNFTEGRPGTTLLLADLLRHYSLPELLGFLQTRLPDELLDRLAEWFEPQLMALSREAGLLVVGLCCAVEDGEDRDWLHFISMFSLERFNQAEEVLAKNYFLKRYATLTSYNQLRMPPLLRAYIRSQLLRLRDQLESTADNRYFRLGWFVRIVARLRRVLRAAVAQVESTDRTILLDGEDLNRYYLLLDAGHLWDRMKPEVLDLILALHPLPLYNGNWKRWQPEMVFAVDYLIELERFAEAARLMNSLAEIHFHDGNWSEVIETCEAIIDLGSVYELPVPMARAAYTAVDACHYLGLHESAPHYFEQISEAAAIVQAEGEDAGVARAWVCLTRAVLCRARGDAAAAYAETLEAEQLLIEAGSPDVHTLGLVYQHQGLMLWSMGRYKEAETQFQFALQIFIDLDDIFTQSFVEGNLGLLNWSMGKLVDSIEHTKGSITVARLVEAGWHLTAQTGNLALSLLYRHDLSGALEMVEEQFHTAKELDIRHEIDRATINRGAILFHQSRNSEAISSLEKGRKIKGLSPYGRACLLMYLARVYARRSRMSMAEACIAEVQATLENNMSLPLKIAVLRTKAEVTTSDADAQRWLREALILAEDTERDFDRAACLLSLARLENPDARQVCWEAGASLLVDMGADDWLEGKSPDNPPQLPTLI